MSVEQLAAIASFVEQVRQSGDADSFCTFEVVDDENLWFQFSALAVNAYYPHEESPGLRLIALGSFEIEEWLQGSYATGFLDLSDPTEIARWIDRYFREVLGCSASFSLRAELQL